VPAFTFSGNAGSGNAGKKRAYLCLIKDTFICTMQAKYIQRKKAHMQL
jgi:hypothetical protein